MKTQSLPLVPLLFMALQIACLPKHPLPSNDRDAIFSAIIHYESILQIEGYKKNRLTFFRNPFAYYVAIGDSQPQDPDERLLETLRSASTVQVKALTQCRITESVHDCVTNTGGEVLWFANSCNLGPSEALVYVVRILPHEHKIGSQYSLTNDGICWHVVKKTVLLNDIGPPVGTFYYPQLHHKAT